jgi:hypothetical protein
MTSTLSLIQRQPDVHYGQIAKFLSLKDLARCQKTCRVFRDRMIVPITERDVANGEAFPHHGLETMIAKLNTAKRVGRTLAKWEFFLGSRYFATFNPDILPRDLSTRTLEIVLSGRGGPPIDLLISAVIRSTTRVRELELPTLTPHIVDTIVESCPLLEKICVSESTPLATLAALARCPHLIYAHFDCPTPHESMAPYLSQFRALQSFRLIRNQEEDSFDGELQALAPTLRSLIAFTRHSAAEHIAFLRAHPQLEEYIVANLTDAVLDEIPRSIQTLQINNSPTVSGGAILRLAASHPSLTSLTFMTPLTVEDLSQIGDRLPQLKILSVTNWAGYSQEEILSLVIGHFPSLVNLEISFKTFSPPPPGQTLAQMWRQS